MINKTIRFLFTAALVVSPLCGHTDPSPSNPVIGDWDAGSRAFWDLKLEVAYAKVTIGSCSAVAYKIIRDDYGPGLNMTPHKPQEKWRNIALELDPKDKKSKKCINHRVIEFAVPDDMQCHAEIAMFTTRKDYDLKILAGWGVWGNKKCHK